MIRITEVTRISGLFAGVLLMGACAPVMRDSWGLAVSQGRGAETVVAPDSLQADVGIEPREPGVFPFSARLYAKPYRVYRLDAFGFPSQIAASYLWNEGRWILVRHDKKQIWEGTGNQLEIEDARLHLPDVHAVLGFLWGRPLPGYSDRDTGMAAMDRPAKDALSIPDSAGQVRWVYRGEAWEASFDPATGLCLEVRSASLKIRYRRYERRGTRALPTETEVFVDGVSVLVIRLRELSTAPQWKKDPFVLHLPAAYKRP